MPSVQHTGHNNNDHDDIDDHDENEAKDAKDVGERNTDDEGSVTDESDSIEDEPFAEMNLPHMTTARFEDHQVVGETNGYSESEDSDDESEDDGIVEETEHLSECSDTELDFDNDNVDDDGSTC